MESELGAGTTFTLRLPTWTELESQEDEKVETRYPSQFFVRV